MDPGSWSRAELKMACLRRIASLRGRVDSFLLVDCVENYLQLDSREAAEFEALRSRRENQEVRAMAMTWSETQQALGRAQGAHQLLLHLLVKRFGPLPEKVRQQVETITSLDRLTELAGRVLSARSLDTRWKSNTIGAADGNIIAAIIVTQIPTYQPSPPRSVPGPASTPRIR